MSGLPVSQRQSDNLFDTPSRQLTGPSRPSSNPRTHSQPPYARPGPSGLASSGRGLNGSPSYTLNGRSSLNLSAASGPQRIRNLTSSSATKSTGGGGLTRSGSESSLGLIGGLKSILSKPFNWLGTPAKQPNGQKRDFEYELESSGQDQMDLSPTAAKHAPKRARRRSPTPPTGPYSPAGKNENGTLEVTGRAVSGFMLPPLPPNVSLQPSRSTRLQQPTNFSRPLTTSHSMPYLDPPLGSPSRNRALGRSRRVDLAAIANGEVEVEDDQRVVKRVEGDNWTAWRSAAMSPPRSTASLRGQPSRDSADSALPSASPFRVPASPSRHKAIQGGSLSRSNTIANVHRAASVTSDVSMGRESMGGMKRSGSLLFGGSSRQTLQNGDADEKMSVDGEGSVLDWVLKDRQSTTPGRSSMLRSGSMGPTVKRGPLVWNAEQGFVRQSDLKQPESATMVGSNEAEKILFALEHRRSTPLQSAKSAVPFSQGGPFPAELVGASTRQIRKAINVPLATSITARAGETARSRREKELAADRERGVSVLISPYGRRRQAEQEKREIRRSQSMTSAAGHNRSENGSRGHSQEAPPRSSRGDQDMHSDRSESEAEAPAPAATPRRSSRLRRDASAEPEPTPKARRGGSTKGKGKATAPAQPESTTPKETPRRSTRRKTPQRSASPPPNRPVSVVPAVPTITETAPSPKQKETTSTYQPRDQSDMSRDSSSLRAKSNVSVRTHVPSSRNTSRGSTPNGSGRYSAKEEDLPDMDELEQVKIPLPSFSGISFGNLSAQAAPKDKPSEKAKDKSSSTEKASGSKPAPTSKSEPSSQSSLGVPRLQAGPLSRLNTRPRASSPLASGSIVAEPESPPTVPTAPAAKSSTVSNDGFVPLFGGGAMATSASKPALFGGFGPAPPPGPPATGGLFSNTHPGPAATGQLFGGPPSASAPSTGGLFGGGKPAPASTFQLFGGAPAPAPSSGGLFGGPGPQKTSGLGLGKPAQQEDGGDIPDFFGKASSTSGTTTPAPAPIASLFGSAPPAPAPTVAPTVQSTKPASETPGLSVNGFNFGAPTLKTDTGSGSGSGSGLFGSGKPPATAEPASTFSFGRPAETKSTFSFGSSTPTNGDTASPAPAKTPEPASFSFAPAATKPAEPKASFSFDQASGVKKDEAKSNGFSFGAPSASTPAATAPAAGEAKAPPFSFGSTTNAGASSGSFSFGKTEEQASTPVSTPGFNFAPAASSAPQSPSTNPPSFSFGAPATNTNGFGNTTGTTGPTGTTVTSGFGSTTPSAPGFTFGSTASTPATNPFGSPATTPAATPAPAFNFGSSTPTTAPPPFGASGASSQSHNASGFNFSFGQSNPPPQDSPSTPFTFGGGSVPNNTPSTPFGFGSASSTTPQTAPFTFGAGGGAAAPPAQQPFQFGAGAPAPSFGAAPGGSTFGAAQGGGGGGGTPGSPAGFSMGLTQDPGSPSGRKIKPLRRGARR